MKRSYYIVYPAIAVGVGALAGLITRQSVKEVFPLLEKPPLSPPAVVFPIVWTALYILMGGSRRGEKRRRSGVRPGGAALVGAAGGELQLDSGKFSWPGPTWRRFFVLILLFGLVRGDDCGLRQKLSPPAARLQAPYLLWLALAGYLNAGIWLPEQIKKEGPAAQNCGAFWRRWRDSNSPRAFDPYTISQSCALDQLRDISTRCPN